MRNSVTILLIALCSLVQAQDEADPSWHLGEYRKKTTAAIDLEAARAFKPIQNKTPKPIIVAVIDAGVDIYHPSLRERLWVNEAEDSNGIDDDGNGYIDDFNGWNFIGSTSYDNLEVTREYVRLNPEYEFINSGSTVDQNEFEYYQKLKQTFLNERADAQFMFRVYDEIMTGIMELEARHSNPIDVKTLEASKSKGRAEEFARRAMLGVFESHPEYAYNEVRKQYEDLYEIYNKRANYNYNPYFNGRDSTVGDDYGNLSERLYGDNNVYYDASFSEHGTHVAGIIAATANDKNKAEGVCGACLIMPIRTVPEGDERDKDVANSIRYAVDNGAWIINMSFGKDYSPQSAAVYEAIAYAQQKGALLIHAAGNDTKDLEITDNYPNDDHGRYDSAWIEVGALSPSPTPHQIASFSNYGAHQVDVFAPGESIYATLPEKEYGFLSGTSMASPVVAGIAGFIWSYYPSFTATEVRSIILDSTLPIKGRQRVFGKLFKQRGKKLCSTGGMVNLYRALQLAEDRNH